MRLTENDKTFMETLKTLMESRHLYVELRPDQPSRMVLRGTCGEKVHKAFGMTRQGVRWRFWRLFNDIYFSAYETILFIEKVFGTELREHAIRISKERYALRQEAIGLQSADALLKREGRQRHAEGEGPGGGR